MPKAVRLVFKIVSIFIILGLVVIGGTAGAAVYLNTPPDSQPFPREEAMRIEDNILFLEVRSGETAYSVGRRLENAGVIRSQAFWYILSRLSNEHIKTGTYRIELPLNQIGIRSILVGGEQILVRVTIPEGATLRRTASLLEDAGITLAEHFLVAASSPEIINLYNIPGDTMEGYLFPETYLFPLAYPANMVVTTMADTFFRRLENMTGVDTLTPDEINDRVIIASIVEREYRVPDEAALMAGVFFNRLSIGMALQSCATVEYVITEILEQPHPRVILYRDLEIRNPFNTYLRPGLPPGPISAPGEIALRAAFNPADTNYLYFRLVDLNAGRHYFSSTYDEHIRAGTLYTKGI